MKNRKFGAAAVLALVRELRRGIGDPRPLSVAGASELVPLLARRLREGGDHAAVVEGRLEDVAALVWIGPADEERLRVASRAHVPIVAVSEEQTVPYVLATDIVVVGRGEGFPVERIAEAVAHKLGEDATTLAARLPALRPAVCDELIASFSKRNGVIGAAVFIRGVDMPLLTLNQIRLVLRLALAHGEPVDNQRAFELLGVVGAGYGLRALARELLDRVPVAGWVVKGGVAYSGTKGIGEAAQRYFESRSNSVRTGS
jgi:uncharacterized protein (DUF697 family)